MSKFKIGDRVSRTEYECTGTVVGYMGYGDVAVAVDKKYKKQGCGALFTLNGKSRHGLVLNENAWEKISTDRHELHITSDGVTTNAVYKLNGKVEKQAKAVCCPSDTFNFNVGAELAINRVLYGTDYNPKDVAIKAESAPKCEPKYHVGQRVIATDNVSHFVKQPATILSIDTSDHNTPFKVEFDERSLVMWCRSGDVEPYTEPEHPKEPIMLYCVKSLDGVVTSGKTYEFSPTITLDSGYTDRFHKTLEDFYKAHPRLKTCLIRAEKRVAKVGEWVVIVRTNNLTFGDYHAGDILKAIEVDERGHIQDYGVKEGVSIWVEEYLVLPDYIPEKVEPTYWSGEAIAIRNEDGIEKGRKYVFKDGYMTDGEGDKRPMRRDPIKSTSDYWFETRFIEYRGEQSC